MRVGLVGIGIMGSQIAARLLECGHALVAWNREPEALPAVMALGAEAGASPGDVAARCDALILCVLDTLAVEEVAAAVLTAAPLPRLVIDTSTIDPDATRALAARFGAHGIAWVDAPVSGGPAAARAGTLTIMAGGYDTAFSAARPMLDALGAQVTHVGPPGAGQVVKVINQAIVGAGYVVMAEALALAEAAGIDAALLPRALAGGHADGSLLQKLFPQMQARAFEPPSSFARQLLKDLKFVAAFAEARGVDLPVVTAARDRYAAYVDQGNAMRDSASIIRLYRD